MTYEEAERTFTDIVQAITGDDDLLRLHRDLLLLVVRYARARTDWRLADRETRLGMDGARTAAHNALIDTCNILSRACAKAGRPIEWRRKLGDDRKEIGDFACHVHALLGVQTR